MRKLFEFSLHERKTNVEMSCRISVQFFDEVVNKRDFLKIINLYTVKKMSKDEMEALRDLKSTLKKNVQDSIEVIFSKVLIF